MTSQNRAIPRPSQPPRGSSRGRSPSKGLYAKKKAEPKALVDIPKEAEHPREALAKSPKREPRETPKVEEEKNKKRSSTSSSSRRRKKKEKRGREKEKRDAGSRPVPAAQCPVHECGQRKRRTLRGSLCRLDRRAHQSLHLHQPGTRVPPRLPGGVGVGGLGQSRGVHIRGGTQGRTRASPGEPNKRSITIVGGDVREAPASVSCPCLEEKASGGGRRSVEDRQIHLPPRARGGTVALLGIG